MVRNPDPLEMRLVLNAGLDDRDNELTTCRESWIRFRFVLIAVAGWMNQHQLQVIDYLSEENRVLRALCGKCT